MPPSSFPVSSSFLLPQLRPFLDFPFPFHITCIPAVPLSRATLHPQSWSFTPGYCNYFRLFIYTWRFRVRNHRWERKAVLVFLSPGYLTQYTIFLIILGYIASSKSAWLPWDLVSKEEKRIWERICKPILFMMIWKSHVEVLVYHSEFQGRTANSPEIISECLYRNHRNKSHHRADDSGLLESLNSPYDLENQYCWIKIQTGNHTCLSAHEWITVGNIYVDTEGPRIAKELLKGKKS